MYLNFVFILIFDKYTLLYNIYTNKIFSFGFFTYIFPGLTQLYFFY